MSCKKAGEDGWQKKCGCLVMRPLEPHYLNSLPRWYYHCADCVTRSLVLGTAQVLLKAARYEHSQYWKSRESSEELG